MLHVRRGLNDAKRPFVYLYIVAPKENLADNTSDNNRGVTEGAIHAKTHVHVPKLVLSYSAARWVFLRQSQKSKPISLDRF